MKGSKFFYEDREYQKATVEDRSVATKDREDQSVATKDQEDRSAAAKDREDRSVAAKDQSTIKDQKIKISLQRVKYLSYPILLKTMIVTPVSFKPLQRSKAYRFF